MPIRYLPLGYIPNYLYLRTPFKQIMINTKNRIMQKVIIFSLFLFLCFSTLLAQNEEKTPQSRTISLTDYGIKPGNSKSLGYKLFKAIENINGNRDKNENITIEFAPGVYHFIPLKRYKGNITSQTTTKTILSLWE